MLPQYSAHLPACTHCWLNTQQPNSTQPSRPWPATPTPLTNNGHIHATARAVGGRGCLGGCRLRGRRIACQRCIRRPTEAVARAQGGQAASGAVLASVHCKPAGRAGAAAREEQDKSSGPCPAAACAPPSVRTHSAGAGAGTATGEGGSGVGGGRGEGGGGEGGGEGEGGGGRP